MPDDFALEMLGLNQSELVSVSDTVLEMVCSDPIQMHLRNVSKISILVESLCDIEYVLSFLMDCFSIHCSLSF